MRIVRPLTVLVAAVLVVVTAAPASAATPGVGTTTGSLEVLGLEIGDAGSLLDLSVLSDFAGANTDTDVNDAGAAAALHALSVAAPALLAEPIELGFLDVSSTGEEETASNDALDLPVDTQPVLGGSLLPAELTALLADTGANSVVGGGIADLDVLEGILGLENSQLGIDANALTESADGGRGLVIDNLAILELGDLLAGLGIPLQMLSLDTVSELVDGLGLTDQLGAVLAGLGLPLDLENLSIESIGAAVTDLLALGGALDAAGEDDVAICAAVNGYLAGLGENLLGGLLGDLAIGDLGDPVCDAVDQILGELPLVGDVLDTILTTLSGTPLLELTALEVGVLTEATDSLETSLADVTASLGGITVAGLEIPGVDLNQAIQAAQAQLDDVLATISGSLDDLGLLDIGLLEEETSVAENGDAIDAVASFTGLRVDLAGLSDELLGSVRDTLGEDSIASLLQAEGLDLPVNPVEALLGESGALSALGSGLSLRVASIGQQSTFTEVLSNTATPRTPQTPAAPELPQTGSNDSLAIVLGAVAAAGALGIRRVLRTKS